MEPETSTFGRVAARIRMPLTAVAAVALLAGSFVEVPRWASLGALALFVVAMAVYARLGTPTSRAVDIGSPVRGRWEAVNSPTSKVPSHGIHAWSQTYAIDLVHDPRDGSRPSFGWWPIMRRPDRFPGFGEPLHAPVSGEVVRAVGWTRDHWSRNSPLGILYLVLESVREVFGAPGVLGNHVVIRADGDTYVLLAHLRRRSLSVRKGDRVDVGDVVARCGNSGNSTEPHVHVQAMDRPSVWVAAGRPILIEGEPPPESGDVLADPGAARAPGAG